MFSGLSSLWHNYTLVYRAIWRLNADQSAEAISGEGDERPRLGQPLDACGLPYRRLVKHLTRSRSAKLTCNQRHLNQSRILSSPA